MPSAWAALLIGALALLSGCASFDGDLGATSSTSGARIVPIFVASTRPDASAGDTTPGRAHYALDLVSVPPGHVPGSIETPSFGSADPKSHFVLSRSRQLDGDAFRQEVAIHISGQIGASRDVLVFVHGFNTRLDEARFRFAQIITDGRFAGVPILFTWPSNGSLFAYGSDKESATVSRDALERLLTDLAKTPGVGRIHVLAHSMGSWLAMEALRENAIAGQGDLGGHLGSIMLASPDIDLNVFGQQVARLNEPGHVSIFISTGDRALSLSSRLAGDRPRVGALDPSNARDHAELDRLGVKVYDLSAISDGLIDHNAYADAPEVVREIGNQLAEPGTQNAGMAPVAGDNTTYRPLDRPDLTAPLTAKPLPAPPGAKPAI